MEGAPLIGLVVAALVVALRFVVGARRRRPPATRPDPPGDVEPPARPGEHGWDVFSRLLKERIIFLGTAIGDEVATVVIAQLLYLESEDRHAPIALYINSPGGLVTAALAIRDTMGNVAPPVHTVAMGQASGVALLLLAHGARGHRSALSVARMALAPLEAPRPDTDAAALARTRANIAAMFAADTGQPEATIARDSERSRTFTPDEAKAYGLIDAILARRPRD